MAALLLISPFAIPKSFAQGPANVLVYPPETETNPTQDFTILIGVLGAENVAGFDLKLTWKTALTDFPPVATLGEFLGSTGISTSPLFEYDNFLFKYVEVGAFLTAPGTVSGDGVLAYFTFHVKADQSGSSPLHIYDVRLFDDNGALIPITTTDGGFHTTAPYVDFTITPSNPDVGQVVTFDGSATYDPADPSAPMADYAWDFGDGSPVVHGKVVTHTYSAYKYDPYLVTLTATKLNGESWHVTKPLTIWRDLALAVVWPTMTETDTTDYDAYQTTQDYYEVPPYGLLSVIVVVQNVGTIKETYSLSVIVSGQDYYGVTHTWDITSSGADSGFGQPYPAKVSPNAGSGYADWFLLDISYNASSNWWGQPFQVPPGQYTITATIIDSHDQDATNNVRSVPFGVHGSVEVTRIVRGALTNKSYKLSKGAITFGGFFENFDNTIAPQRVDQGEYGRIAFDIYQGGTLLEEVTTPALYLNYLQGNADQYKAVWSDLAVGKYDIDAYAQFGTDGVTFPYFGYRHYTFTVTITP